MDLPPEPNKNPDLVETDQLFYILGCAVKEDDAEKRFELVVEACRLLGKIMPYKRKMVHLFQQRDFFFYLIVLESFNKRPVQIIMNAFMDKITQYTGFIPIYIESFLELAKAPEPVYNNRTLKKQGSIASIGAASRAGLPTREISKEIIKFMVHIKLLGLEYWEKFIEGRLELIYNHDQRIDFFKLGSTFILNTDSEKVAQKACAILDKILKDKTYGELLISDSKKAGDAISVAPTNLENIKKALLSDQELYGWRSPSRKKSMSRRRGRSSAGGSSPGGHSDQTSDYSPSIMRADSQIGETETIPSEEAEILSDKQNLEEIKDIQDPLEEWLYKNDIPLIAENEAASQFFKVKENYELFFTFLLEPTLIECSGSFSTEHNNIIDMVESRKDLLINSFFKTINYDHLDKLHLKEHTNQKAYHPYLYRAHKCKQVLMNQKNWEYLVFGLPNMIGEFFAKMYTAMRTIFPKVSIPLILSLLEYFIQKDPDQTVTNLIHYNFLYVLLWNLERPLVRDFTFKLMNLPLNPFKFGVTNSMKLAKFMKYTDFFIDYINLMVTPEYGVDIRKCETQYKPGKLSKIFDLSQNTLQNAMNRSKRRLLTVKTDGTRILDLKDPNKVLLAEERLGLNCDIDGIMDIVKKHDEVADVFKVKKNGSNKSINTSDSKFSPMRRRNNPDDSGFSDVSINEKKFKVYPSLMEAYSKLELRLKKQQNQLEVSKPKVGSITEIRSNRGSAGPETAATSKKVSRDVTPRKVSINSLDREPDQKTKKEGEGLQTKKDVSEPKKLQTLSGMNADAFHDLLSNLSQAGARDSSTILHKMLSARNPSVTSLDKRHVSDQERKKKDRSGSADLSNSFEKLGIKESSNNPDPTEKRRNSAKLPTLGTDRSDTSISISVASIFVKNSNNNVLLNLPIEKIQKIPGPSTNRSQFSMREIVNLIPNPVSQSKTTGKKEKQEKRSQSVPNLNAPIHTARNQPSKALAPNLKLPELYPIQPRKLKLGEIEKIASQASEFSEEVIKSNEAIAYPLAEFLYYFIEDYFNNLQESRLMTKLKVKNTGDLRLLQSIRGNQGHIFFKLIYQNYLVKMVKARDQFDTSGVLCGKMSNLMLQRLRTFDTLKKVSKNIHEECSKNFVYLCKMIIDSTEWKAPKDHRVYLQNFVVHETIGTNRMMLLQTFTYIIENDSESGFQLLTKIPDTLWHALQIWLIELKHHNLYQITVLKIYDIALKYGNEKVLYTVLFKLNLLGDLATAYQDIFVNGSVLKMLHVDSFILAMKILVNYVGHVEYSRAYMEQVVELLSRSQSWALLKKEFLPERASSAKESDLNPSSRKMSKSQTSLKDTRNKLLTPVRIDSGKNRLANSLKAMSTEGNKSLVDDEKRSRTVIKVRPDSKPKVKFVDISTNN